MPHILTIDIGSSSVRVLVFDQAARPVAGVAAHARLQIELAADGTAQIDVETLLAVTFQCIDTTLALATTHAVSIAAVAVDTFVSNFVALDQAGQPLTPLILYSDTRNAQDAATLQAELDEHAAHQRTGCLLRTSYWPARLAWLRRTHPAITKAARFATVGELVEQRLFGRSRISTSVASWTGLLDRRTLAWDIPLLDHLGVAHVQLGQLVDANEPLRGLRGEFQTRWPALAAVPWFPAIGDGAAANIGSGCVDSRTLALTVGTTGALRVVREQVEHVPHGLWCYRVDTRRALLGGATSEGGNVVAWLRRTAQIELDEATQQQLAALAPDGHGLTVLPFFAGERSPGWAGDAKATITGLTLNTTPLELLRASLEAVSYRFALIAQALIDPSAAPPMIIASGGALLRSPLWMQICADVLGLPVTAAAEPESTSRGAALLALESLGLIADLAALPAARGATYQPDHHSYQIYRAAIERQRELYDLLIRSKPKK
ncbi:MAG: gluconokinase [Roseiflexaceae bacterium]|nr:gluconokinase [Roseiflexaceae bacterium]